MANSKSAKIDNSNNSRNAYALEFECQKVKFRIISVAVTTEYKKLEGIPRDSMRNGNGHSRYCG